MTLIKPSCPACSKPMRLIATGRYSKTFVCMDCKERVSIDREEPEEHMPAAVVGGKEQD